MGPLDHWHPVLLSTALKNKPVEVRLNGQDIVLFRAEGKIGALDNCCPHRRLRLSVGQVVGDRLQCKYHGWTFDCAGAGESPGTPKLHATTTCFDTCEKYGVVWLKNAGSPAKFPEFAPAGFYPFCTMAHEVNAPLELTLDNFTEIEHTPTTHGLFGYALDRMHEVEVRFEPTDETVRVINVGPQKEVSAFTRFLLGIRKGFHFNDDWTTFFSPIYSIYDHWWTDPASGKEAKVRFRIVIFFNPIDEGKTGLFTFGYTKSAWPGPYGGVRLFKKHMADVLEHEIQLDVNILNNLADKNPNIDGMKLSRFDRVLGLNRERIDRVYRGYNGGERVIRYG